MRSIDLFCGAGGLSRGLEKSGWETIAAIDYDPVACRTYAANFPAAESISADTHSIDFRRWFQRVELVAGGPPCQPFSVAGLQLADRDPRDCVPEFIRAVREIQPQAFLLENVAGLAAPRHRLYLLGVIQQLEALDYEVRHEVLDAADYGAPQFRRRLFIVGIKGKAFRFPSPTHGTGRDHPYATAGEAIRGAPPDIPNSAMVTYARKPVLRPQPWDGMLVNGGGRPINLAEPSQTIPATAGGNRTHILDPDGVLLRYHAYLLAGGEPRQGIVDGVQRLTVNQSARIQSFPDHHTFLGPQSARYRQVGNAVPPLLAACVSKAILTQLRGGGHESRPSLGPDRQLTFFAPLGMVGS